MGEKNEPNLILYSVVYLLCFLVTVLFGDNISHVKECHISCCLYLEYVNLLFPSSPAYVTPEVPKCIDLECVRATYVFQRYVILQLTTEMLASSISNHRKNKDEMQEASNQKILVLKHSASFLFLYQGD